MKKLFLITMLFASAGHADHFSNQSFRPVIEKEMPTRVVSSIYDRPDVVQKANEILQSLTTEEKIAQMFMLDMGVLFSQDPEFSKWLETNTPGAFLYPCGAIANSEYAFTQKGIQMNIANAIAAIKQPNAIPVLVGIDNVHGAASVEETPVFPHNINFRNMPVDKVFKHARASGSALQAFSKKLGINMAFSPTVALSHDERWGRNFESAGPNVDNVQALAAGAVSGIQQIRNGKIQGVLATAKHYIGDGDSYEGRDKFLSLLGPDTDETRDAFYERNGKGFMTAIDYDVGCIMLNYGANGFSDGIIPHHFDTKGIAKLRQPRHLGGFGFKGFIVTDDNGQFEADVAHTYVQELQPGNPYSPSKDDYMKAANLAKENFFNASIRTINAGADQLMISVSQPNLLEMLVGAIKAGVSLDRINEACGYILRVKVAMGMFDENPFLPVEKDDLREGAVANYQAAFDSLYYKGNESSSLIPSDKTVLLLGREEDPSSDKLWFDFYDDLGLQSGGWTLGSYGVSGHNFSNFTSSRSTKDYWSDLSSRSYTVNGKLIHGASTIREGFAYRGIDAVKVEEQDIANFTKDTAHALVVLGEFPYYELVGDVENNNPLGVNGYYWLIPEAPPRGFMGPFFPVNSENQYDITLTTRDVRVFLQPNGVDMPGAKISLATYNKLKAAYKRGIKTTAVLLSGRDLNVDAPLNIEDSDPFGKLSLREVTESIVYAYFPGTSGGEAIVDFLLDTPSGRNL